MQTGLFVQVKVCSRLGGVMCLREGEQQEPSSPLETAVLGPVPTAKVKLLGMNVLPPLTYPEESEVTWKSKLNNALVQL